MPADVVLSNPLVGKYFPGQYYMRDYFPEVYALAGSVSTAPEFYVLLKDWDGQVVALFTDWLDLTYVKEVNAVGSYSFTLSEVSSDPRLALFDLDFQVEVYRRVPGAEVDWYLDFEGFHRRVQRKTNSKGEKTFTSIGVGYNDLLARTSILYKVGTIRADKNAPAETVMKEYVSENCTTSSDLTAVGRLNYDFDNSEFVYLATLPGFSVQTDGGQGSVWTGSMAFKNLLDALQEIGRETGFDFNVVGNGAAQFVFQTFENQLGEDRSTIGLVDRLNGAGNTPVIFSLPFGVVQSLAYDLDRIGELNAIAVLGKGERSTRKTVTRADTTTINDSPWNRRETSRPVTNYDEDYETYSLQVAGDQLLEELKAIEKLEFEPLQQPSQLYGKHYFFGDKVTARYGTVERHKRLSMVKVSCGGRGRTEKITIKFSDV